MKELNINWEDKIVKHNGFEISLGSVKGMIKRLKPELVKSYQFDKKFNKITGEIEYKHAWDSIFFDFNKSYGLKRLFNILLRESGYGQRK